MKNQKIYECYKKVVNVQESKLNEVELFDFSNINVNKRELDNIMQSLKKLSDTIDNAAQTSTGKSKIYNAINDIQAFIWAMTKKDPAYKF